MKTAARCLTDGWEEVWRAFRALRRDGAFADEREQAIATDLFFILCLDKLAPAAGEGPVWDVAAEWYGHRQPPWLAGGLPGAEQAALTLFCVKLRDKIDQYLAAASALPFATLDPRHHPIFITVWRQLFLNSFSPLQLYLERPPLADEAAAALRSGGPAGLLRASLRHPFDAHLFAADTTAVWDGALPAWAKIVLSFWLSGIL